MDGLIATTAHGVDAATTATSNQPRSFRLYPCEGGETSRAAA
jgi:hypothetical protein